jgi:hypothetical protein
VPKGDKKKVVSFTNDFVGQPFDTDFVGIVGDTNNGDGDDTSMDKKANIVINISDDKALEDLDHNRFRISRWVDTDEISNTPIAHYSPQQLQLLWHCDISDVSNSSETGITGNGYQTGSTVCGSSFVEYPYDVVPSDYTWLLY